MDDAIISENSIAAVKKLQSQLIQFLKWAGMYLYKWKANHTTLIENVNNVNIESYSFSENERIALLFSMET